MSTLSVNLGGTYVNRSRTGCDPWELAPFQRLDTYLETHLKGEVPYLIKIDVEGHELLALSTAKDYFLKNGAPKHVFSEFTPTFLERAGSKPVDYLNFLWDLGMTITHNGETVVKDNEKYQEILLSEYPLDIYAYSQ